MARVGQCTAPPHPFDRTTAMAEEPHQVQNKAKIAYFSHSAWCTLVMHERAAHISRGRWGSCQLVGFSVVVVIVALFVPNVCPVGAGGGGVYSESP